MAEASVQGGIHSVSRKAVPDPFSATCTNSAVVVISRFKGITEQHRNGHRPHAPGTGVIHPARLDAVSKPTSPISLPDSVRLIPTSITVAPGLIHSPSISPGLPAAAISTSASATKRGGRR